MTRLVLWRHGQTDYNVAGRVQGRVDIPLNEAGRAQAASAASAAVGDPSERAIRQVVFSNGRGYVVVRGRRFGVGETLDGARIERVTEQAVWLRESGQLRREPLYGGVEKRPTPSSIPAATAASGVKNSKEKP